MWLCQENKPVGEYKVALGKGGINKIKQGDNKTPLGEYTLGIPRPSSRFGTFIPIGYPTQEQISKGYTGGDIGVHGPYRFLSGLAMPLFGLTGRKAALLLELIRLSRKLPAGSKNRRQGKLLSGNPLLEEFCSSNRVNKAFA